MTLQELYASINGSYDAVKQVLSMDSLISKFIIRLSSDDSCERLMKAASANDAKGMFEAAHSMKGVCANLGLLDLSSMAGDVAEEFRPGKARKMSDEALAIHLGVIKEKYKATMEAIQKFASEQG